MRTHLTTVFLALLLILCPPGFLLLDGGIDRKIREDEALEKSLETAREELNDVYRSAGNLIQVRRLLERFQSLAGQAVPLTPPAKLRETLEKLYAEELRDVLPRHDLALAYYDPFREKFLPMVVQDGGLGSIPGVATQFLTGIVRGGIDLTRMTDFSRGLKKCLGFPVFQDFFNRNFVMNFHLFNSFQNQRGLYVQSYPSRITALEELQNLLFVVLDLDNIPADFWVTRLLASWGQREAGLGLLPIPAPTAPGTRGSASSLPAPARGDPLFSSWFDRHQALRGMITADRTTGIPVGAETVRVGDFLLCYGVRPLQDKFYPVVAVPVTWSVAPAGAWQWGMVGVSAASMALGGFWLLQLFLWKTTPRIAVAAVLGGVFLGVMLPAVFGIWGISRIMIGEQRKLDIAEAGRSLESRLAALDAGNLSRQAVFVDLIRKLSRHPDTVELLRHSLRAASDTRPLAMIVDRFFQSLPWENDRNLNGFLLVSSDHGATRGYHRLRGNQEAQGDFLRLLFPVARKAWENATRQPGALRGSDRGPEGVSKSAIEFEMVRDALFRVFGVAEFQRITNFFHVLMEWKINLGRLNFLSLPVRSGGKLEFIMSWIWDEYALAEPLYDQFRDFDPSWPHPVFWTYSREGTFKALPPGIERYPDLRDLIQRAKDTALSQKRLVKSDSGDRILEARHSRFLTQNLFAGEMTVADSSAATRWWFTRTILALFLLVLVLAFLAARFFMTPFHGILRAIRKMRPGVYDIRIEGPERGDEFGTLAAAFHSMLKGLQEREMLGKYVSGSVRRLVQDRAFAQSAQEGMNREVTVIFSGLAHFAEFQAERPPAEVFALLNRHLSVMTELAGRFGGEISKVIGDKLLVIFDHETCADPREAAGAAMRMMLELRRRLADCPLAVVSGINTGPVIAGILGSEAVRRDYTVVGDTVNLAARLATLAHIAEGTRIVISGETLKAAGGTFRCERLPFKRVKGKSREVEAYLVVEEMPSLAPRV